VDTKPTTTTTMMMMMMMMNYLAILERIWELATALNMSGEQIGAI